MPSDRACHHGHIICAACTDVWERLMRALNRDEDHPSLQWTWPHLGPTLAFDPRPGIAGEFIVDGVRVDALELDHVRRVAGNHRGVLVAEAAAPVRKGAAVIAVEVDDSRATKREVVHIGEVEWVKLSEHLWQAMAGGDNAFIVARNARDRWHDGEREHAMLSDALIAATHTVISMRRRGER